MAQYKILIPDYRSFRSVASTFFENFRDARVTSLLESVLNQVLQAQATEQLAAELYEQTEARQGYRNGT